MSSQRHQKISDLFRAACELAPEARTAFLDQACAKNPKLRVEVEALLAQDDQHPSFLEEAAQTAGQLNSPPVELDQTVGRSAETVASSRRGGARDGRPDRIGPYKILDELGEGGMGIVYLAEQTEPIRRRVALKVIKRGMDTKQVLARLESERQALALMNHPNVAKLLDAGTTDAGLPYFVMEHVHGVPITDYCDRHRLSTPERLKLFMQVCQAVQHAHRKGIIHRDIKPSNVLVSLEDDIPAPKVIDFGVAKATQQRLTERTLFTEQGQMIGTPEYMSPEQAEMSALDVDTRTDIYSLGVLLYELLTSALPFERKSLRRAALWEIQRIIREEDAPKPSTRLSSVDCDPSTIAANRRTDHHGLERQLRGDLDWITLKALEKDRTRRYATAAELADDIARHLNHEPVLASPPSVTYRLGKWARKRRVALAFVAVLLVSLSAVAYFQSQASRALAAITETTQRLLLETQLIRLGSKNTLDRTEIDEAIANCAAVIKLDPDLAAAYALRANLFTMHGESKYGAAKRDAHRALELEPENLLALRSLGYLHLEAGEFESALDAYNRGMIDGEGLPADFHNRARLLRISGDSELALTDHDRAVAMAPHAPRVYLGRGITRRVAGDIAGAIKDFSKMAAVDPQQWAVQGNQWIWEVRLLRDDPGDREAAVAALAAAQEAATKPIHDKMLAMCRGELSAEELLREAENGVPPWMYYYLGVKARVDGRRGDAEIWFKLCRDIALQDAKNLDLPEFDMAGLHLRQLGEE